MEMTDETRLLRILQPRIEDGSTRREKHVVRSVDRARRRWSPGRSRIDTRIDDRLRDVRGGVRVRDRLVHGRIHAGSMRGDGWRSCAANECAANECEGEGRSFAHG